MKTKGLQVLHGYVFADTLASASGYGQVPVQFWNRLKHAIAAAHLVDEFKAADAQSKTQADVALAERRLFQDWTRRLGLEVPAGHYDGQQLWPWTRGWTEQAVDTYLTKQAKQEAA